MNTDTTESVSAWEFVEEYYKGYYYCSEISRNDDLQKIVDGEINGFAEELFNIFIEATGSESEAVKLAQQKLHESNAYVFQKAIEDYLKTKA